MRRAFFWFLPCLWLVTAFALLRAQPPSPEAQVGGRIAPDGKTQIDCDLPGNLHLKNIGGSDGAGLCVFTSITHSARWQNVPLLENFRDWMKQFPGGGYPQKVDEMIAKIAKEKGIAAPAYIQVEGDDLEILKLACKTGRMPGVTYSFSPTGRYGGQQIAHMVSLPHADNQFFAVLDNNYPGDTAYEWLTPEEFKKTYAPGGRGWAVILLNPSPPMPPKNPKWEKSDALASFSGTYPLRAFASLGGLPLGPTPR